MPRSHEAVGIARPARRRAKTLVKWAVGLVVLAVSLMSCSTVRYYAHLASGESSLLSARRPVADILADPATDPQLRRRLQLSQQARAFASDRLMLPRNRSYTTYADLHRPYATWNVFAAPEFSLRAHELCYPVAGCVAYRGYYEREQADAFAAGLRAQGFETWVGGVPAFSTLGWFADPILNTMLRWSDDRLAAMIFHELAHQRLYVKGDTEFNESFATFVQREGLRQWRASRGLPGAEDADEARIEAFEQTVLQARGRLQALYASGLPPATMRARKAEEIARLRADLVRLRDARWGGHGLDDWIGGEINNARLLPFGLYDRWVGAFGALFRRSGGDWNAFYAAAERIATRDAPGRHGALAELDAESRAAPPGVGGVSSKAPAPAGGPP